MNLFPLCAALFAVVLVGDARPQVPYDYIPLGIEARRDEADRQKNQPHASDLSHVYEQMNPSGRKFIDVPGFTNVPPF